MAGVTVKSSREGLRDTSNGELHRMTIRFGKNEGPVEVFKRFVVDELNVRLPGVDRTVRLRMHEADPEVFKQDRDPRGI